MAGNLDRSLDDILKERRTNPRRSTRRVAKTTAAAAIAPAGGIKKNIKAPKATTKKGAAAAGGAAAPTGPVAAGPSKIIVSNLPMDVTESQIKDYFVQTIGIVKKVLLTYGPNGQSRGVATIIFSDGKAASEAAKLHDGTKVDGRPMRVEVVLGAKQAPTPAPAKALSERISQAKQPKNQPKSAAPKTAASKAAAPKAAAAKKTKKPARGRNAGRGKPKTAEELDAEMNDYFVPVGDANMGDAGGAVQPVAAVANGGDAAMDEVL